MISAHSHRDHAPERGAQRARNAWTLFGVFLALALGVLSACSDMTTGSSTRIAHLDRPSLNTSEGCPPDFTASECQAVEDALNYLNNHWEQICREMGGEASSQWYIQSVYTDRTTTDYGYMFSGTSSGIYLGNSAFNPGELANTLAHEASHFKGYEDHMTTSSHDVGDKCAGPI